MGYSKNRALRFGNTSHGWASPLGITDGEGAVALPDWWDPNNEGLCVWEAHQAKGVADFASSLVDLSGNGHDAVDPGGAETPTWDAVNGWTFDGIANNLELSLIPQNDQSQSVLVQYTDSDVSGNTLFGVSIIGDDWKIIPFAGPRLFYWNGDFAQGVPVLLAGNLGIAGNLGYRNGVVDSAPIAGWVPNPTVAPLVGALINTALVKSSFLSVKVQAIALYDCVLTGPQMLAIATAMALL